MQRKATKQSRAANAEEKAHIKWVKERGICSACGGTGGVIAHHCEGATFKVRVGFERVQIGHWFVLGLCQPCDNIVTRQSRAAFRDAFGAQSELWLKQAGQYRREIPINVMQGIAQYGR